MISSSPPKELILQKIPQRNVQIMTSTILFSRNTKAFSQEESMTNAF